MPVSLDAHDVTRAVGVPTHWQRSTVYLTFSHSHRTNAYATRGALASIHARAYTRETTYTPNDIRGQREALSAAVDCDSTRYVPITSGGRILTPNLSKLKAQLRLTHRPSDSNREMTHTHHITPQPRLGLCCRLDGSGVATSSCLHGDRSKSNGSHPPSTTVDDTGVLRTWSAFP